MAPLRWRMEMGAAAFCYTNSYSRVRLNKYWKYGGTLAVRLLTVAANQVRLILS